MPSVIRGSDNFDTAGGNAVKAWVNFNGTGTVAIRAQYNVSSITDNGVGDYTVNFTTAMPDANYCFAGGSHNSGGTGIGQPYANSTIATPFATGSFRFRTGDPGSYYDVSTVTLAIFR